MKVKIHKDLNRKNGLENYLIRKNEQIRLYQEEGENMDKSSVNPIHYSIKKGNRFEKFNTILKGMAKHKILE